MEKLLTRREVAEVLSVPVATLDNWATRGFGPAYVIVGRHARYRPSDVERWLESRARMEASS